MAAALTALLALSWQPLQPLCTLAPPHSTPPRAAALRMESDGSWWDLRQQAKARQRKLRIELRWSLRRVERTVTSISSGVETEVARRRQGSMLQSLFEREQVSSKLSGDGEVTRDDEARASLSPSPSTAGAPTDASNLRLPGRRLAIVSTAALPWQTGTSVNPLLRAAHLATKGFPVCLVLPWLSLEQQPILFPAGLTFSASHEQEAWLRAYLQARPHPPPLPPPLVAPLGPRSCAAASLTGSAHPPLPPRSARASPRRRCRRTSPSDGTRQSTSIGSARSSKGAAST